MKTGGERGSNFRFLFAYVDWILRPAGRLVNLLQSRSSSGSGHIGKFVIIKKLPQHGAIV
jgi:hypothetical protein